MNLPVNSGQPSAVAVSYGDPRVCVAVLDGPVDLQHPCFLGARIEHVSTFGSQVEGTGGPANVHGTQVASIIFGQPGTLLVGLAPHCRGVVVPVFSDTSVEPGCSQLDLARAILVALEHGANVINISGGRLADSPQPDPLLADALAKCHQRGVLVIAAMGNEGCDCFHIPAAVWSVLAVGAVDIAGRPHPSSNWSALYRDKAVFTLGVDIPAAMPGGELTHVTGSSYAAAYLSGTVARIASWQLALGKSGDPLLIKDALLATATPVEGERDTSKHVDNSLRVVNVDSAIRKLSTGESEMTTESPENSAGLLRADQPTPPAIASASCGCEKCKGQQECTCSKTEGAVGKTTPQLVYALGRLGYDFGTETRRDSYVQLMPVGADNPAVANDLLRYLDANPYEAASLIWTLNLDATPIYAVQPAGPFASEAYERIRECFEAQINSGAELVSIPGAIAGSARLMSGQTVPLVVPAMRGMYCWETPALIKELFGEKPDAADRKKSEEYAKETKAVAEFLSRVYYDLRNLGVTPEDRAMNYAATNAFQIAEVARKASALNLDLDNIDVKKSPVCRPDADCYDVELAFFNPDNTNMANRIYRFTVDVSDVLPVTIGEVRGWPKRARF